MVPVVLFLQHLVYLCVYCGISQWHSLRLPMTVDIVHLHMLSLVKQCSKFSKPGFSNTWTVNFQIFKLVLEKAEEPEIKLPTSTGSWKNQENSRKNIYFWFIDYAKAFDCVYHNKLCKLFKRMEISDHLTCLLGNLYAGQEATVRTRHRTLDRFKIGKGIHQGCILSLCLFNFYAEYIMWKSELDKAQAGIKIAGRNINLRFADDITLMVEREEELKSSWWKWKRRVKTSA